MSSKELKFFFHFEKWSSIYYVFSDSYITIGRFQPKQA